MLICYSAGLSSVSLFSAPFSLQVCLINISLELLRTKVYHLKNPFFNKRKKKGNTTCDPKMKKEKTRKPPKIHSNLDTQSNWIWSKKKRRRKAGNLFSVNIFIRKKILSNLQHMLTSFNVEWEETLEGRKGSNNYLSILLKCYSHSLVKLDILLGGRVPKSHILSVCYKTHGS